MASTTLLAKKSINAPDEVREFPSGRIEIVELGDVSFSRSTFEPGWRWSQHVKPLAGTESCEFPHEFFMVSGRMHVRMDDGTELDLVAGDVAVIGPGHDAWVVGDEPVTGYDFGTEDADYAKP
jgi:quercetin dioxygenase-like cupin family protein